jgi:uncharacterized membrane protein YhaH (DUF805 family)
MKTSGIIHFLSAKGRLSMGKFWLYWLLIVVSQTALLTIVGSNGSDIVTSTLTITAVFTGLLYLQIIKRMHDIGRSGWYSLVPIYNLILALSPGDEGTNEYGPDPKGVSDDTVMTSEVLDQQIPLEEFSVQDSSIQQELKNFLIYTIVSRLVYLLMNTWWSFVISTSTEEYSLNHDTYEHINTFTDVIFTTWLFVLMGKSVSRWLQWLYLIFIAYSAVFEVVRSLI